MRKRAVAQPALGFDRVVLQAQPDRQVGEGLGGSGKGVIEGDDSGSIHFPGEPGIALLRPRLDHHRPLRFAGLDLPVPFVREGPAFRVGGVEDRPAVQSKGISLVEDPEQLPGVI
jgi:hypothetical protein